MRYDVIIVGSGPGGASVAREASRRGLRVLVLEQGSAAPIEGTLAQMASMAAVPGKGAFFHRDASLLVRGLTAGGSSTLNFATAAAPPLARFAALGIDLAPELDECRTELPMSPLPDELIGPMAARIMQGALAAGLPWRKLDKMIRPQICRSACWRCVYGCPYGAKWTARDLLDEAVRHGARLIDEARTTRVLPPGATHIATHGAPLSGAPDIAAPGAVASGGGALRRGSPGAIGVEYVHNGVLHTVRAERVVLAAGGIGTPRLLHASGLGPRAMPFFSDPVVAVMGAVDDINGGAEVPMAAGMALPEQGISFSDLTLPKPMYQAFALQVGRIDRLLAHRRTLSIMVKIRDVAAGATGPHWADKTLQPSDKQKFREGVQIARRVLQAAGAKHIFKSWHFAAHPGGTVPIGAGVDTNLQTPTPGLYVCDASVLPAPWGLPPTLTLLCLGKRLGKALAA